MTERLTHELRGRRARWSAAVVAAPLAAAVFAGTTGWAATHDPSPPSAPAPAPQATARPAAPDPVLVALRKAVRAETARVKALRRAATRLKTQAAALAASGGTTASSSWSGSTSTASGSSGSGSSASAPATVTIRVPVAAPAPAPAPATHTTTGASGAKP